MKKPSKPTPKPGSADTPGPHEFRIVPNKNFKPKSGDWAAHAVPIPVVKILKEIQGKRK